MNDGPTPIRSYVHIVPVYRFCAVCQSTLEACRWRVAGKGGVAELLGLKPSTLAFRMKKLGIARPG